MAKRIAVATGVPGAVTTAKSLLEQTTSKLKTAEVVTLPPLVPKVVMPGLLSQLAGGGDLTDWNMFYEAIPDEYKGPDAQSAKNVEILYALLVGPYEGAEGESPGLFDLAEQGVYGAEALLEKVLDFLVAAQTDGSEPFNDNFLVALYQLIEALGSGELTPAETDELLAFFDEITSPDSEDGAAISDNELAESIALIGELTGQEAPEVPGDDSSNLIPDDAEPAPTDGGEPTAGQAPPADGDDGSPEAPDAPPDPTPAPGTPGTGGGPSPSGPNPTPGAGPTAPGDEPEPAGPGSEPATPADPSPSDPPPTAPEPPSGGNTEPGSAPGQPSVPGSPPTEPPTEPPPEVPPSGPPDSSPPVDGPAPATSPDPENEAEVTGFGGTTVQLLGKWGLSNGSKILTTNDVGKTYHASNGFSYRIVETPETGAGEPLGLLRDFPYQLQTWAGGRIVGTMGLTGAQLKRGGLTLNWATTIDRGVRLTSDVDATGPDGASVSGGLQGFIRPAFEISLSHNFGGLTPRAETNGASYDGNVKMRVMLEGKAGLGVSNGEPSDTDVTKVVQSSTAEARVDFRLGLQRRDAAGDTTSQKYEIWFRAYPIQGSVQFALSPEGDPMIKGASKYDVQLARIAPTGPLVMDEKPGESKPRKWARRATEKLFGSDGVFSIWNVFARGGIKVEPYGEETITPAEARGSSGGDTAATTPVPGATPNAILNLRTAQPAFAEASDAPAPTGSGDDGWTVLNIPIDLPDLPELPPELVAFQQTLERVGGSTIEEFQQVFDRLKAAYDAKKSISKLLSPITVDVDWDAVFDKTIDYAFDDMSESDLMAILENPGDWEGIAQKVVELFFEKVPWAFTRAVAEEISVTPNQLWQEIGEELLEAMEDGGGGVASAPDEPSEGPTPAEPEPSPPPATLHPTDWDHKYVQSDEGSVAASSVDGNPALGTGDGLTMDEWAAALLGENALPASGAFTLHSAAAHHAFGAFSQGDGVLSDDDVQAMITAGYLTQRANGSWQFNANMYAEQNGLDTEEPPATPPPTTPTTPPPSGGSSPQPTPSPEPDGPTPVPPAPPTTPPTTPPATPPPDSEIAREHALIELYDYDDPGEDGHGTLSRWEMGLFVTSHARATGPMPFVDGEINTLFNRYDSNGDGVIGPWELKAMIDAGDVILHPGDTASTDVAPTDEDETVYPEDAFADDPNYEEQARAIIAAHPKLINPGEDGFNKLAFGVLINNDEWAFGGDAINALEVIFAFYDGIDGTTPDGLIQDAELVEMLRNGDLVLRDDGKVEWTQQVPAPEDPEDPGPTPFWEIWEDWFS